MSEWIELGKTADFEPNKPHYHNFEYESAVIWHIDGNFYAIEDRCSHDDNPLGEGELDGCAIVCPRHGARFDIRTGKALSMPAVEDINQYATKVEDDIVWIQSPDESW